LHYESAALFFERAQAVKRDFVLSNENAAAVAQICVRLDGLPLALELAAARVRVLPPATLLARLDRSLRVLTGGAKDLPARQQTLRATIDWSYSLLSREDQRLFAGFSVFVGGCTLEAADAIRAADVELDIDVLDGLTSLVEKSLLRQRDIDGEVRFSMLETVREYAAERLDERPDADAIRRAHAEHFKSLSEAAAGEGHGHERHAWVSRLEREQGNLRAALAFWRCEPDSQLAIAHSIYPLWWRGRWEEGRRWLEEGLATCKLENTTRLRALSDAYYLAYVQNDHACARRHLDELLTLSQRLGDRESTAAALHGMAMLAFQEGDNDRAASLEEESLTFAEGKRYALFPLSGLAWDAFFRVDYVRAREHIERSIDVCRAFGDDSELAETIAILAVVAALTGETQEAHGLLDESLALLRKLDNTPGLILRVLPGFAILIAVEGDATRALKLIGAAEALREALGASGGRVALALRDRVVELAAKALDAADVEAALAEGRSLTLDEALASAVEAPSTSETVTAA
jgi:tetratricopeptide (TPR) repeat protein